MHTAGEVRQKARLEMIRMGQFRGSLPFTIVIAYLLAATRYLLVGAPGDSLDGKHQWTSTAGAYHSRSTQYAVRYVPPVTWQPW